MSKTIPAGKGSKCSSNEEDTTVNTLRFETGEDLVVRLQSDEDAALRGWDQGTVELIMDGDPGQCAVERIDGTLSIHSHIPVSISMPGTAPAQIGTVSGDLILRDLGGAIAVDTVHGDCLIKSVTAAVTIQSTHGDLTVDHLDEQLSVNEARADVRLNDVTASVHLGLVHGDLRARGIGGEISIGSVHGDVRVRDVQGAVTVEEARGDLKGTSLHGGMEAHHVKGDMSLKSALTPGKTYRGRSDGEISARFPADASARFTLEADGELSAALPHIETQEAGRVVGQAGEGEAQVVLTAKGDLSVRLRGPKAGEGLDWTGIDIDGDLGAQIEAQIAEHLSGINVHLARHEIDRVLSRAEHEVARAKLRAEEHRQRAEARAVRPDEAAAAQDSVPDRRQLANEPEPAVQRARRLLRTGQVLRALLLLAVGERAVLRHLPAYWLAGDPRPDTAALRALGHVASVQEGEAVLCPHLRRLHGRVGRPHHLPEPEVLALGPEARRPGPGQVRVPRGART